MSTTAAFNTTAEHDKTIPFANPTVEDDSSSTLAVDHFVFIMSFTGPHFEEALNVLMSLSRVLSSTVRVHVFSKLTEEQKMSLSDISRINVNVHELEIEGVKDVATMEASWGTTNFSVIVKCKFAALLHILAIEPSDTHLVWLDTDLFFLKDPIPALLEHNITTPAPMHFQHSRKDACTGFFYMPGGLRQCQTRLVNAARERLLAHHQQASGTYKDDERCFNEELATKKHTFTFLSRVLFPNGEDFFDKHISDVNSAIVVHNNFIKGLPNKIQRFKEYGMWLVAH